ncbi:hypothetical protein [Nocardia fluminea]
MASANSARHASHSPQVRRIMARSWSPFMASMNSMVSSTSSHERA